MSPATFGQRRRFCLKSNRRKETGIGDGSGGYTPIQSAPGRALYFPSPTGGVLQTPQLKVAPKCAEGPSMVATKAGSKTNAKSKQAAVRLHGHVVLSFAQADMAMGRTSLLTNPSYAAKQRR